MPWVAALVIAVGVARLVASPQPALATSPAADAESLIRDGVALRRQQHDVQALPFFQKAYDLVRNPRTAGQLGLCELSLGYWIEAEQHLKEALAIPGHPWVTKNQASLDVSLKRARENIGELAVTGAPDGAEISINGRSVGRLPLRAPLRLARGAVDIDLRAPGYVTSHRSLSVTAEAATLDIKLERERVPVAAVARPPSETLPARLPPETHVAETPHEPSNATDTGTDAGTDAHPGRALRWAAATAAVLGVAALGGAVVETVRWQSGVADFQNHKVNGKEDCQLVAPLRGGADCQAFYDKFTSDRRLAIIGYAVGGGLAAVSLTLFLIAPRWSRAPERVAFGCAPTLLDPGVACRFSF